jgi:abortive infection bacteriophage resistance protein
MDKEFKTVDEQIEILKQRGLNINEELAKEILKENNYYYLINGYKEIFVENNNSQEIYKTNTSLEEIYALYNFDSELRINLLRYILIIERRLDTFIAYEFSKAYGNKEYLIESNFDNNKANGYKITSLIADIRANMTDQIKIGNKMLNHYIKKYGYVPLWVLIRIMTLGEVSRFYELMKQKDQNAVAKNFSVREKDLKTYLHNISIVRNICAHDEKLYDLKLNNAIVKSSIHFKFNLDLQDGKHSNGYKDLFSIVIILKILLKDDEFNIFYNILISDIERLKANIKSISFSEILNKMGFPENYKEL